MPADQADDWDRPGERVSEWDTRPAWPIFVALVLILVGGVTILVGPALIGTLVFGLGVVLILAAAIGS